MIMRSLHEEPRLAHRSGSIKAELGSADGREARTSDAEVSHLVGERLREGRPRLAPPPVGPAGPLRGQGAPEAAPGPRARPLVDAGLEARQAQGARSVGAGRVEGAAVPAEEDALADEREVVGPEQGERQGEGFALGNDG